VWALKQLSIKIHVGESVAVLGHNGAGKSTLIKVLASQTRPSSGVIRIFGKSLAENSVDAGNHIGFVAHESYLYDELSVEENLQFYAKLFSVSKDRFNETIKLLNLQDWLKIPAKNLSHGMRKRADIARALIHNPNLILLDELFSGLDEDTRNFLVDYLKGLKGRTLVISSHSVDWAKQLCERSLKINRGSLESDTLLG
jgi:ABC-type multidrug transport system ATPase subunit